MDKIEKYFIVRELNGYWRDGIEIVAIETSFDRAKETAYQYLNKDYGTPEPEITICICAVVEEKLKRPVPLLRVVDFNSTEV